MDETGLRTVFHQHIGTLVETADETRRLLDIDRSLRPRAVSRHRPLDVRHGRGSGGRGRRVPREDLARPSQGLRHRLWSGPRAQNEWDGPTSVGHGVFCELGKGGVDFPGVLRALDRIGYTGWMVVEQDVLPGMGTPRESARRNREYLRSIGA